MPTHAVQLDPVDPVAVGNTFAQLTQASIAALIRDHLARGRSEHSAGDYRASILSLAIACEVALDNALAAMLWEEGETAARSAQIWVESSSITHRVRRLYAERLGGDWRLDVSSPIGNWRIHIVDVRNSVIHSGRLPSIAESSDAGHCAAELISFISERLVLRWKQYPKTLAMLCGPSSVERYSSKKQRNNVLEEMDRCSSYAVDFHHWRDEWLKERASL